MAKGPKPTPRKPAGHRGKARPAPIDWRKVLGGVHSETRISGYWSNLELNCSQWASEATVGLFWKEVAGRLGRWRNDFNRRVAGDLLTAPDLPPFVGKGKKRICEKVANEIRKDPESAARLMPSDDPPIPRLNDLVRTRVSCRFVDGVEYLATKLEALAVEMDCSPKRVRKGSVEGYYAQHVNFTAPFLYRFGGAHRMVPVTCEIQVATHLSTWIWESTHSIYERARIGSDRPDEWQWDPNDFRFISRQLGHTIHLADGLLCQVRDLVATSDQGVQ